jgi:DNA polymerase-1
MLVLERTQLDRMWMDLATEEVVGIDTETRGLAWWKDPLCGISIASRTQSYYIPVRHGDGPNCPLNWILEIRDRLQDRPCVLANGNFDWHVLRRDGWLRNSRLPPLYHDVQIAAYVINENQRLKLEELAKTYLGIDGDAAERELYAHLGVLLGKKKVAKSAKGEMWRLPAHKVAPYAEADALHTRLLLDVLLPQVQQEGLGGVYRNLIEYQRVLHDMEEYGLWIDQPTLEREYANAVQQSERLAEEIKRDSGGRVKNPNSFPQLGAWLGTESTAKKFLKKLEAEAKSHSLDEEDEDSQWWVELPPRLAMLRQYRQWSIAARNYYAKMRDRLDNGVLHPQLKITGAKVRLSCGGGFNAQAIPKVDDEKPKPAYDGIKRSIAARPGRELIEIDYSQAEIVMAAHYSQDPTLLEVIGNKLKLHDVTAARNQCSYDAAKMQNFMVPYGVGALKYAEERGISLAQGKAELEAHYRTFPKWRELNFLAINEATRTNKIRLWSGRTRHFSGIEHKRRTALNVLIQGGVTECLREATVKAWHKFPDVRLGLTVHDSNIGDVPEGTAVEIWPELRKTLTDFPWMSPRLDCEMKAGRSWASAKKVQNG